MTLCSIPSLPSVQSLLSFYAGCDYILLKKLAKTFLINSTKLSMLMQRLHNLRCRSVFLLFGVPFLELSFNDLSVSFLSVVVVLWQLQ